MLVIEVFEVGGFSGLTLCIFGTYHIDRYRQKDTMFFLFDWVCQFNMAV